MCAVSNGIMWYVHHVQSVFASLLLLLLCNSGIEITFGIRLNKLVKALFVCSLSISAAHIMFSHM